MTRKFGWLSGAALLAVVATSSTALAAVNLKSLPEAEFSGTTVIVTNGEFSGLGNIEAIAKLTVTGVATYQCENPTGKVVPGQNPVEAKPGEATEGLGNSEHNGRGTISKLEASVTEPPTPTAKQVGCGGTGNTKWTVTKTGLEATGAQLVITQKNKTIFCRNYTTATVPLGTEC
jgi:hypothetical protein